MDGSRLGGSDQLITLPFVFHRRGIAQRHGAARGDKSSAINWKAAILVSLREPKRCRSSNSYSRVTKKLSHVALSSASDSADGLADSRHDRSRQSARTPARAPQAFGQTLATRPFAVGALACRRLENYERGGSGGRGNSAVCGASAYDPFRLARREFRCLAPRQRSINLNGL